MKQLIVVLLLILFAIPVYAVPGWLIGFSVGVSVQVVPWTRNHIIMPPLKLAQRTVRPIPQDKIDKANKKAMKLEKDRRRKENGVQAR